MRQDNGLVQLLKWYVETGVDEALEHDPLDRLATKPSPPAQSTATVPPAPGLDSATAGIHAGTNRGDSTELVSREEIARSAPPESPFKK